MEMKANGDITHKVYEASMRGCVATLNTLIQNDPFILNKISLTSFSETPLHISALLGHLDFTKALLRLKPQLATELDSFQHSPLHFASAEGHRKVVTELLRTNTDVCLVADQQGRIPLHLAAMRGRVEVVQELLSSKPESMHVKLINEEDTVLHLCVRYNHLDALKLLVAAVDDEKFLNLKNREGNTILQLSAKLKQLETFRYLVSVPQVRVDVNSLMAAGFLTEGNLQQVTLLRASNTESTLSPTASDSVGCISWKELPFRIVCFIPYFLAKIWLEFARRNEVFQEMRGPLMVVATVFAGMSYQAGISVQGGYWQEDTNKTEDGCPKGLTCKAGTSILSYTQPTNYTYFVRLNFLGFFVSWVVILILIVGLPLKNNLAVGILVFLMVFALLASLFTYSTFTELVSNHHPSILDLLW